MTGGYLIFNSAHNISVLVTAQRCNLGNCIGNREIALAVKLIVNAHNYCCGACTYGSNVACIINLNNSFLVAELAYNRLCIRRLNGVAKVYGITYGKLMLFCR